MMNKKDGFFRLRTPHDLFCKAKIDIEAFHKNPNDYLLFDLVCTLNHLKEWIEKENNFKNKGKPFCLELGNDSDYKIINKLSNNAKHFIDNGIGQKSESFSGFMVEFSRIGDRLGQQNFTIDGQDLRDIIVRVLNKYKKYFETADEYVEGQEKDN